MRAWGRAASDLGACRAIARPHVPQRRQDNGTPEPSSSLASLLCARSFGCISLHVLAVRARSPLPHPRARARVRSMERLCEDVATGHWSARCHAILRCVPVACLRLLGASGAHVCGGHVAASAMGALDSSRALACPHMRPHMRLSSVQLKDQLEYQVAVWDAGCLGCRAPPRLVESAARLLPVCCPSAARRRRALPIIYIRVLEFVRSCYGLPEVAVTTPDPAAVPRATTAPLPRTCWRAISGGGRPASPRGERCSVQLCLSG